MSAREEILRRVRAAHVAPPEQATRRDYSHVREHGDRLGQFVRRVEDYKATVIRTGPDDVAAAVAKCLVGAGEVVVPSGFDPTWVPDGLNIIRDEPALRADQLNAVDAVLTCAVVGIAETGTIVLDHTAGMGRRTLTLVPDLHVCVVTADQVVGDVPEAVARLGASVKAGRPLTWISGGSATVDIELHRVEGVHGPRTLCVVLVEPAIL
ncbi:MAG: lactate utilization protein C [Actinomycetota bacterium]